MMEEGSRGHLKIATLMCGNMLLVMDDNWNFLPACTLWLCYCTKKCYWNRKVQS